MRADEGPRRGREGRGARPPGPQARGAKKKPRAGGRGWGRALLKWGAVAAIWVFVAVAAFVGWCAWDLPEADNIPALARRPQVTILARDGTMFLRLGDSAGPVVPATELPRHLIQAV